MQTEDTYEKLKLEKRFIREGDLYIKSKGKTHERKFR